MGYFYRHIIPHHHVKESKQKERERGSGIIGYRHRLYKQRSPRGSERGSGRFRKRVRKIQREGQKEWDIDTGREVDEDDGDDGDCGRWMLQNVSNMDESVRGT